MLTSEQLEHRFRHHPPKHEAIGVRHENVRAILFDATSDVLFRQLNGEESREASMFVTKMEEAMFWANAAIARNQ